MDEMKYCLSVIIIIIIIFITHGGDEVLPVRHPRDHVDHGPRHHPGHHVARRPDCAQFLSKTIMIKLLTKLPMIKSYLESQIIHPIIKVTFAEEG